GAPVPDECPTARPASAPDATGPATGAVPADPMMGELLGPVLRGSGGGSGPGRADHRMPVAQPPEHLVSGRRRVGDFMSLAATVLSAPARLGGVRLVAVDGRAGSGKTTFAGRLAAALTARGADTAVLHTDDLLQGWLDIVTFWHRLEEWVLSPLRRGEPARYRRFDWSAGRFRDEWETVGRPDVLVVEGVTTARAAVRPELTTSIYLQVARETRFERGLRRDGPGVLPDWSRWMLDEDRQFAADPTAGHVDVLIDGEPSVPHATDRQYVQIAP
ncbi:MAG: hypothetical protein WCA46_06935, partial [Actinocatenispora sp.]